mmetsp:Transcript_7909/g.9061  ORF Transcript_7909/g.9061 Transcript_7909/m.9061 type:complete len:134 (+) Transcript_7909:470-871(+)
MTNNKPSKFPSIDPRLYYGIMKIPKSHISTTFIFNFNFFQKGIPDCEYMYCQGNKVKTINTTIDFGMFSGRVVNVNTKLVIDNSVKPDHKEYPSSIKIDLEINQVNPNGFLLYSVCFGLLFLLWGMGVHQNNQ